MEVNW